VWQLRSGPGDQDVARAQNLSPHIIVSMERGAEALKVRETEICILRFSVESYVARKAPCGASVASGSARRSATVGIYPVALPVARYTFLGSAHPQAAT
jgi:hypothetical protein